MTLTEAKQIGDDPGDNDYSALSAAYDRLLRTGANGGVRNSERALARLQRRLGNLRRAMLIVDRHF